MSGDLAVRMYLTTHLFVGFDNAVSSNNVTTTSSSDDKDSYHEKLLFHARIREIEKNTNGKEKLFLGDTAGGGDEGSTLANFGKSAISIGAKITMIDKVGKEKDKDKTRYICITVKKNMKIRLHKIKQEKQSWQISKSWSLDDIKLIENGEDLSVTINLGKTYVWILDDNQKKTQLLFTLLKVCNKYTKKLPKLINMDEESLKSQMQGELDSTDQEVSNSNNKRKGSKQPRSEHTSNESVAEVAAKEHDDAQTLINLSEVLDGFNWNIGGNAADLELRLNAELQALEAANVHAIIQSEEQGNIVVQHIQAALQELEVVDQWIQHYTSHLNRMGQDVHQIESRNNSMQVTSMNQRSSLQIPGYIIEILRNEPLDDEEGIYQCEEATVKLAEVIHTKFEDDLGTMQATKERIALFNGYATQFAVRLSDFLSEFFKIQAATLIQNLGRINKKSIRIVGHDQVEERLSHYRKLLKWLKEVDTRKHMELQMVYITEFSKVYKCEINDYLEELRGSMPKKINSEDLDYIFQHPVTLSVSSAATQAIKSAVSGKQDNVTNSPSIRHSSTSNSVSHLGIGAGFDTVSNTGSISLASSAKAAVKNTFSNIPLKRKKKDVTPSVVTGNQTSSYHGSELESEELSPVDLKERKRFGDEDRVSPDQILGNSLSTAVNLVIHEQNFIMEVFALHDKSPAISKSAAKPPVVPVEQKLEEIPSINVTDTASSEANGKTPDDEANPAPVFVSRKERMRIWVESLDKVREPIKDVKVHRRVQEIVENMFDNLREDLQIIVDNGTKHDSTYAVGMMIKIEELQRHLANTCYLFLVQNILEVLHKRLLNVFEKFVDDQIKAIEETKVTIKKRSGLLLFIRIFPRFVERMEKMLGSSSTNFATQSASITARSMVNKAYDSIVRTIFETLEIVAKEVGMDVKVSEEKEQVHIHILTIENMHHFHAEIRLLKVPYLEQFVKQSKMIYETSLNAYIRIVIRKPLGRLLEFFEGIDELLRVTAKEEICYHLQYSKAMLRDVVKKHPAKEIKKALEQLYKRVEKHYPEPDANSNSPTNVYGGGGLLQVVWRGIQEELTRQFRRYEEIILDCYPDSGVRIEVTIEELLSFFSELARNH
ncbi:hypothetical protein HK098_004457 [Nowakowskiella sp. JEL0407]|nr:hypothetical protein HK098_004457 [Nowakowskiella sp. JEL0407]